MILKDVSINNFRTLNNFNLCDLGSLHVITGVNNSGKTNFLRALDLFFNESIEGGKFDRVKDIPNHIVYGTRPGHVKTSITVTLVFCEEEINNLFHTKHKEFRKKYL